MRPALPLAVWTKGKGLKRRVLYDRAGRARQLYRGKPPGYAPHRVHTGDSGCRHNEPQDRGPHEVHRLCGHSGERLHRMAIDEYKRSIDEGREYKVAPLFRDAGSWNLRPIGPVPPALRPGRYPGAEGQETRSGGYVADGAIAAVVISYDGKTGTAFVAQRNKFYDGEGLSILSPGDIGRSFKVSGITNEAGERVPSTPHAKGEAVYRLQTGVRTPATYSESLPKKDKTHLPPAF